MVKYPLLNKEWGRLPVKEVLDKREDGVLHSDKKKLRLSHEGLWD